MLWVVID